MLGRACLNPSGNPRLAWRVILIHLVKERTARLGRYRVAYLPRGVGALPRIAQASPATPDGRRMDHQSANPQPALPAPIWRTGRQKLHSTHSVAVEHAPADALSECRCEALMHMRVRNSAERRRGQSNSHIKSSVGCPLSAVQVGSLDDRTQPHLPI